MNAKTQLETDFKNRLTAVGQENIPQNIAAWSFELSEPYEITLVGSTHFDESDDDWACPDDDDFHPALLRPTYLCCMVKTGKLCWKQSLTSCGN
jgi:hypothetical protein